MAFSEVIKIINTINESILEGMTAEHDESNEEFHTHLQITKSWYSRISCVNKKLYMLALLEDVRSAWTLSLLLKSIWNCHPKDSVFSVSGPVVLSAYDQSPLDNNRTALPVAILTQVMNDDRQWFTSLEAENQAIVLVELLSIAGGPVVWQVLKRAQKIYERYREFEIDNLKESVVVSPNPVEHAKTPPMEQTKKEMLRNKTGDSSGSKQTFIQHTSSQAQKRLEESLAVWESSIKLIRDSFKLDEVETTFRDGTKKKIWKVDRPMAEVTETVDFLQLLPSAIGKRILAYLPFGQLNEYARVNKYWAYLIDEYRAEVVARQKTNIELEKLRDIMLRNCDSTDTSVQSTYNTERYSQNPSQRQSVKTGRGLPSIRASQKSGPYSFRHLRERMNKGSKHLTKPIRNMADFYQRLERRGAADENIPKWCKNLLKQYKKADIKEGVQKLQDTSSFNYFPRFLSEEIVKVPLSKALVNDPTTTRVLNKSALYKVQLSKFSTSHIKDEIMQDDKRFSLWSRDFSSLYPVSKIASHQSPF